MTYVPKRRSTPPLPTPRPRWGGLPAGRFAAQALAVLPVLAGCGTDGAPTLELAPDNDTAVMASDETMDSAFNSAKPEPVTSSSHAGLPRKGGRHSDGKRG